MILMMQDVLKTVKKGLQAIEEEAKKENPRGIVIDNTNYTLAQRSEYLKAAKEHKYNPVVLFFDIDKTTCMRLDKFRETNKHREHISSKVGSIPIHSFFKKLEMPTATEGFGQIYTVNLVLKFANDDDERFYNMIH